MKENEKHKSALKMIVEVLGTNLGRDKFYRLIQYTSNYSAEFLLKHNYTISNETEIYKLTRNTGTAFATARKIIRFTKHKALFKRLGINYNLLKLALRNKEIKKIVYYSMKINSDICFFTYLFSDHIMYFNKFFKYKHNFFNWNSWYNDFVWFIQEWNDFILNLSDLYTEFKSEDKIIIRKLVFKCFINILNAFTALGFFSGAYPRYFTVLFGVFSTLIWWFIYLYIS